jgi:hypothetical protein
LNPPAAEEEEADDDDQPESSQSPLEKMVPDWNKLMGEGLAVLRSGSWTEIDAADVDRLWLVGEKQVGGVTMRVLSAVNGDWQCLVLSLAPEVSADLRMAQRAHNNRITRWIESLIDDAGDDLDDELDWDGDDLDDDTGPVDG